MRSHRHTVLTFGVVTTVTSLSSLSPPHCHHHPSVLDDMVATAVYPNLRSYKLVISSWSHADNPPQAAALLKDMQHMGVRPDHCAYNLVIDAWSANKEPAAAEQCLDEMRSGGVEPDASCYTSVVGAWQEARNAERAQNVLAQMVHSAITSSLELLIAHNLIIVAWGDLKR